MKMADFRVLPQSEQLTMLNKHLTSIKGLDGRLEDNFKGGIFDFSYSLLKKNAADLGIIVDGKNYVSYALGDEPPVSTDIVMSKQNNVKQQQVIVEVQQTLTADEIAFVKQLYKTNQVNNNEQHFFVNGKPMLVVPTMVGAKKTTGISVYIDQWKRWTAFKERHNMYSGTDLMALALDEFMEKYKRSDD